ncbi:MAG: hypothetical protein EXR79_05405 [Myxococcales bacterium]|nr:hypothetical protein [Myxococcales bacterium]
MTTLLDADQLRKDLEEPVRAMCESICKRMASGTALADLDSVVRGEALRLGDHARAAAAGHVTSNVTAPASTNAVALASAYVQAGPVFSLALRSQTQMTCGLAPPAMEQVILTSVPALHATLSARLLNPQLRNGEVPPARRDPKRANACSDRHYPTT